MLRRTLAVHWQTLRWPLAALAVLAFALPVFAAGSSRVVLEALSGDVATSYWLRADLPSDWTLLFPLLAAATGVVVALGVWYWDHRLDHVHALSLPVTRARYVLVKLAAGSLLVGIVAVAFLLGAVVAAAGLDLPEWLHAYPGRLALKFVLAALVVYALVFAFAAATIPTALKVLTGVAIVVLVVPVLPFIFDASLGELGLRSAELVTRVFTSWPGPFAVLGGDWTLVGV